MDGRLREGLRQVRASTGHGLRLRGGGGGTVVADPGNAGARRAAGRLTQGKAGEAQPQPRVRASAARPEAFVSAASGSWASRPHALARSAAGRLNAPRPALVEAGVDGAPRVVNRQQVALRARGMAGRRPLVDGGAARPPLLRGRARVGAERVRLPRPGAWLLVHAAGMRQLAARLSGFSRSRWALPFGCDSQPSGDAVILPERLVGERLPLPRLRGRDRRPTAGTARRGRRGRRGALRAVRGRADAPRGRSA